MPRQKKTKTTDAPVAPLEGDAVLKALRSNLKLLGELAARYEVNLQPERPDETPTIACPRDAYDLLGPEMKDLAQEQLRVLLLNVRNGAIGQRVIYQGNVNSSAVRPAEVLRPAIIESAPSIVISHNHPSGDPTPSPEDVKITRELVEAGNLLDIAVMDHLIIAGNQYVSLKQKGLLTD